MDANMTKYNVEPLRTAREIAEFRESLIDLGKENAERDNFLFTFGINTGLRVSDILLLKVSDILGKSFVDFIEQKTNKVRRVTLSELAGDIINYCEGNQPMSSYFHLGKVISLSALLKPIEFLQELENGSVEKILVLIPCGKHLAIITTNVRMTL